MPVLFYQVPAEFITQNNKNANPPTLILTLHSMIKDARGNEGLTTVPGKNLSHSTECFRDLDLTMIKNRHD